MARGQTHDPAEPVVQLMFNGVVHNVPQSQVKLQQMIADAVKLDAEIGSMKEKRAATGQQLEQLIAAQEAEVTQLRQRLEKERQPWTTQITAREAELELLTQEIAQAAQPLMGDQRSMRYTGAAGVIQVTRNLALTVLDKPGLRKFLGSHFGSYFQVEETFVPAKNTAVELFKAFSGAKLSRLQTFLQRTETVRARLVPAGK